MIIFEHFQLRSFVTSFETFTFTACCLLITYFAAYPVWPIYTVALSILSIHSTIPAKNTACTTLTPAPLTLSPVYTFKYPRPKTQPTTPSSRLKLKTVIWLNIWLLSFNIIIILINTYFGILTDSYYLYILSV